MDEIQHELESIEVQVSNKNRVKEKEPIKEKKQYFSF